MCRDFNPLSHLNEGPDVRILINCMIPEAQISIIPFVFGIFIIIKSFLMHDIIHAMLPNVCTKLSFGAARAIDTVL